MPLATEVGFGPGDIVLDGDPATPKKGAQQSPLFDSCLLWPNGRPSHQLLSSCLKTKMADGRCPDMSVFDILKATQDRTEPYGVNSNEVYTAATWRI